MQPLRRTRSTVRLALMVCAAGGLAACGGKEEKRPAPTPEAGFIRLTREAVPLEIELPGRTAAYEMSEVRPQVTGVIKARLFEEGAIVRQGQTLYQIDPSLYRAAANEAQATLANARAASVAARARADRFRPLAQMEAVATQDYVDAEATARQAAATVAQNAAQLETANVNLRFTRVPAPITGRVNRSLFTTGALVTAGQADPLTTIQRLDPIFVDIQQSAGDLLALRRSLAQGGVVPSSAAIRIRLEDGQEYPAAGRVQFAEAMVDATTGTVTLRARFPNPQGLLLPGMYVRARLSQATATSALLVPQTAVSRDPRGSATVMLVGPGDKAVRRNITATRTVGDKWLVTAGLNPGDRVIVEGPGRIKAGGAIRPVPAGSKPQRAPGAAAGGAAGDRGGGTDATAGQGGGTQGGGGGPTAR